MSVGVLICGLNGAGKSMLGKALAEKLQYRFIDSEDLYFPQKNSKYPYTVMRSREEAEKILLDEIRKHENFVFASVNGDYGPNITSFFQYVVIIEVPKEIRMQRVKNRSFQKFGDRMLPGGDCYEQEKQFFEFVQNRKEDLIEKWVESLDCTIIHVDGIVSIEENVNHIAKIISF